MPREIQTHDAVRAFAEGGLAAVVCMLVVPALFGAARGALAVPQVAAQLFWAAPVPLSLGIGGIAAGALLGAGRRGIATMGSAMVAAGLVQVSLFGDLNRLTGHENPLIVVVMAVAAGVTSYGTAGAIAAVGLGRPARQIARMAAGFAAGGLLSAAPVLALFGLERSGLEGVAGGAFGLAALFGQTLSVILPFMAVGAVIAWNSDPDVL